MLQRQRRQQQQLLLLLLIFPLVVVVLLVVLVVVVVSCCCFCCSCNTLTTTFPSRLQVARQSYILEISHIHLCDWRCSLTDITECITAMYSQVVMTMKQK